MIRYSPSLTEITKPSLNDCVLALVFLLLFANSVALQSSPITATGTIRERERASGTNGHLPIIALTAHAMEGD